MATGSCVSSQKFLKDLNVTRSSEKSSHSHGNILPSANRPNSSISHVIAKPSASVRNSDDILVQRKTSTRMCSDSRLDFASEAHTHAAHERLPCQLVHTKISARQGQNELISHVGMMFKNNNKEVGEDDLYAVEGQTPHQREDFPSDHEKHRSRTSSFGTHSMTPMELFVKEPIAKSLIGT